MSAIGRNAEPAKKNMIMSIPVLETVDIVDQKSSLVKKKANRVEMNAHFRLE